MNKKGFTLIELLVVIAIIGLLSSIVLVSLGTTRAKARDSRRYSDFHQVNTAMELCYQDFSCAGETDMYLGTAGGVNDIASIGAYLPLVPSDPVGTGKYQYTWTSNAGNSPGGSSPRKYYCAFVKLEKVSPAAMVAPSPETFICTSNLGIMEKTSPFDACGDNTNPCNADCCGMSL